MFVWPPFDFLSSSATVFFSEFIKKENEVFDLLAPVTYYLFADRSKGKYQ